MQKSSGYATVPSTRRYSRYRDTQYTDLLLALQSKRRVLARAHWKQKIKVKRWLTLTDEIFG
jgi:hypothetical protein